MPFEVSLRMFLGSLALPPDEQKALGEGDFGFEALAAAIKQTGWKGWIISEEGGNPRYANNAALGADRRYIRKIFGV